MPAESKQKGRATMTGSRFAIRVASVPLAVLMLGCAETQTYEPVYVQDLDPEPQPMLSAASDAQVTVFGEFPGRTEVPYYSRAMTSLLRHTFCEEGADFDPSLDQSGHKLVFASTRHSTQPNLYIKDIHGAAVTQLTSDPSADVQPSFSPDGEWVAFASDRAGNWDIWVIRTDGTQTVQVTHGPEDDIHPSWSPDGNRLVFCSLAREGGQWEMWIANATAGATKKFIGYGLFPEWAPDGNKVLFQRARERGSRWFSIWTINLDSHGEPRHPTEIVRATDHAAITPSWEPGGERVAYCTVATVPPANPDVASSCEVADIWVVDGDGRSRTRLTDGHTANFGPVWSAEGRIFFTSTRGGYENIWSLTPGETAPGGPVPVEGAISQGEVSAGASPEDRES
jgi:Tol biopolymer transport system component